MNWKEIVQRYIIKYSNQIGKTTHPLKNHFGISYFTYHKIDDAGNYTVLVDRPDWAEHYVSKKIFLNDPYLRHPSVYQSGFCYFDSFGSPEYRETVHREGKIVLDMDVGITLIQKSKSGVEFFGFTGNKKSSSLQNLYLNHPEVLRSFALHFKKEMASILRKMEDEAGSLTELKGKDFFCEDLIHPDVISEARKAYYKDLGYERVLEQASRLSLRERQCLELYLKGKSAKETAEIFGLSTRTIESYFESIKNKTSCWDKRSVLQFAKTLDALDLLS